MAKWRKTLLVDDHNGMTVIVIRHHCRLCLVALAFLHRSDDRRVPLSIALGVLIHPLSDLLIHQSTTAT